MRSESSQLRVVLDTTVFVSGMIVERSNARRALNAWRHGRFVLITLGAQRAEIATALRRPKIARRYAVATEEIDALFRRIDDAADVVSIGASPIAVRDVDDEAIVATALAGAADYLVTGDKDLLVLADHPDLGALQIVTPRVPRHPALGVAGGASAHTDR